MVSEGRLTGCILVVAHGNTSAAQWVRAFVSYTTLQPHEVCLVGDADDTFYHPRTTRVVVGTLPMLTRRLPNGVVQRLRKGVFVRGILDECHCVPTDQFGDILTWKCATWSALTASPLRADGAFSTLCERVGEEFGPAPWAKLEADGFIAPLRVAHVECVLPLEWTRRWQEATLQGDTALCERLELYNPGKFAFLEQLLRHWGWSPDGSVFDDVAVSTTLVFVDTLELLHLVARRFSLPYIDGSTPFAERECTFNGLRSGSLRFVAVSRCGDVGIDLPRVKRCVQLDSLDGSQRQFVQRAGRALRPYELQDAEFYDVYSALPGATKRAWHRSTFLREQGYTVKRVRAATNLSSRAEDELLGRAMLQSILTYQTRVDAVAELRRSYQNGLAHQRQTAASANARMRGCKHELFKVRLRKSARTESHRVTTARKNLVGTEVLVLLGECMDTPPI